MSEVKINIKNIIVKIAPIKYPLLCEINKKLQIINQNYINKKFFT